jgi:hypothetical protein
LKGGFIGDGFQREGEETVGVDDADRWVPLIIGGRGERIPFQDFSRVGQGRKARWAGFAPRGPFLVFFSSFLLFLFLFSISFIDFAY